MQAGNWRRPLAAICAIGAAVLLYGVQSVAAQGTKAALATTGTVNFVTTNTNTPGFAAVITAFEAAYPGITVNASYLNSNQYNAQIPTELAAGSGPDVFTGFPGTGALPAVQLMAQGGDLESIPLTGNFKAIPKDALGGVTYKGKVYGYPLGQSAYFMLYNTTVFKKFGFPVPKTYADLNALCTRAKADGKVLLEQAGSVQPNNGVLATQMASGPVYLGDPNWNAQKTAGKTSFVKTAGWTAAMTEFQSLAQNGCFEPGAAGQTVPGATAQFASGGALIWLANSQNIGLTFAANPNFPLGVAATPAPTLKQQDVMVAYPTNLLVNAHSPNMAAAETFLNFFANPTEDGLWAKDLGYSSLAQVNANQLSSFVKPLTPFYKKGLTRVNPFFLWPNPEVFADESTEVQGLLTGQTNPATVLAAMDSAWSSGG
jgi:raffinose/stachyose/melibiose transport system substrate-binding protein